MGWLNKIFKGSSHKVSEGQYDSDGRFGEDTIGNGPSSSGDAWSSEIEDIDLAIVLSLSEEDKRKSVVGLIGYPSDDINMFLWMVRIGGGVFPHIKEPDYLGCSTGCSF